MFNSKYKGEPDTQDILLIYRLICILVQMNYMYGNNNKHESELFNDLFDFDDVLHT